MTNPQDIDKAFYEICTPEWYLSHGPGFGVKAAFIEGANWAAALRAVQEPDYKVMWEGMCDYIESHWRGAGVKNTLDWALGRLASRYNSLENELDEAEAELEKLRAVQEPVAVTPQRPVAWLITWVDDWKTPCAATRYAELSHKSADAVRRAWDANYPDNGPHAVEALVRATPPPPGAAAPLPAGWVAVPVEPTEDMFIEGMEADCLGRPSIDDETHVRSIWKAMLAAATPLPKEKLVSVQTSEPDEPDEAICSACHGTGIEGIDRGERSMPRCEYCGGGGSIRLARQEKP